MNPETTQERKDRLSGMEKQLRLAGEILDSLWMAARHATGQAKTDIHNKMGPLREKQRMDREAHEALKVQHASLSDKSLQSPDQSNR